MNDMESWLAAIVESSDDAIVGKTLDGVITSWNPAAQRLFGYSADEAIGRNVAMLVPADRSDEEVDILARIGQGQRIQHFETVRRRKDGTLVDVALTISPVVDRGGRIVGASKIARDITERKRTQAQLHGQLERLFLLDQITRAIGEHQDLQSIYQVTVRAVEERMPLALACVCTVDKRNAQLVVNRIGLHSLSLQRTLGLAEQGQIPIDANGLSRCVAGALVYEADTRKLPFEFPGRLAAAGLRSLVAAPLQSDRGVFAVLLAARQQADAFTNDDCEFLRQLTTHVSLAARHAELHGSLRQAYDELRDTQQVAMQHDRMRALGEMASGVAHDIKNALFPALAFGETLLESTSGLTPDEREQLQSVIRSVRDVAAIVDRVREFYRPREVKHGMASLSLNALLPQVVSMCRVRWSDMARRQGIDIDADTELADDAPLIAGSETEIREALVNLVFNAVDAMPGGGTLRLRTRRRAAQDVDSTEDGTYLEVADTGVGMNEETRRRCLDPFFTTKGDRGTGMGLAMVYSMAQRHGAHLEIRSEPGRGTTISIFFPAFPQPPEQAHAWSVDAPLAALPKEGLRLLVIDDDPLVLEALQTMLSTAGNSVVAADGGRAGIDTFTRAHSNGDGFELVVTDLGMPDIDGRTVAGAIKRVAPQTPVILLSGWGEGLRGGSDGLSDIDAIVSKPPRLRELRELIDRLVTRPMPSGD